MNPLAGLSSFKVSGGPLAVQGWCEGTLCRLRLPPPEDCLLLLPQVCSSCLRPAESALPMVPELLPQLLPSTWSWLEPAVVQMKDLKDCTNQQIRHWSLLGCKHTCLRYTGMPLMHGQSQMHRTHAKISSYYGRQYTEQGNTDHIVSCDAIKCHVSMMRRTYLLWQRPAESGPLAGAFPAPAAPAQTPARAWQLFWLAAADLEQHPAPQVPLSAAPSSSECGSAGQSEMTWMLSLLCRCRKRRRPSVMRHVLMAMIARSTPCSVV